MIDLDLDINHYEVADLELFFKLSKPYNHDEISKREIVKKDTHTHTHERRMFSLTRTVYCILHDYIVLPK